MSRVPPAVGVLADRLAGLGWVTGLLVAGSLATGDYVPGVSDLDLVALTEGPVGRPRQEVLTGLHRDLDHGAARGLNLGCMYVDAGRLADAAALHPVWTHGMLVHRSLSGVTRAELVRHGFAVLGRPPSAVLPDMTDDDVRQAARAELCGYWAWAIDVSPRSAITGLSHISGRRVAQAQYPHSSARAACRTSSSVMSGSTADGGRPRTAKPCRTSSARVTPERLRWTSMP